MKYARLIFWLVFISTFIIRILVVSGYNFPFTTDQGRDMLDLREIVYGPNLKLTGPTTSINGVYMGPFYYYFNLIPFIISRGDPQALVYWQIIWYQLAGLALWLYLRKADHKLAFISSFLFLLMPLGFYTSRFAWSAHPMPIVMVFYFLLLHRNLTVPTRLVIILLGIVSGLGLQTEAALGILLFPYSFLVMAVNHSRLKNWLFLFLGFALTLIPQLLFEVKHQFIMTQTLIGEFTGTSHILGGSLPIPDKFSQLVQQYTQLLNQTNHLHPRLVLYIFVIAVFFICWATFVKKTSSYPTLQWTSLIFLIISFIFYLNLPLQVKHWYLYGLAVPMLLITATFFAYLWNFHRKPLNIMIVLLLIWTAYLTTSIHIRYYLYNRTTTSPDPSLLSNEIVAVDWVYQQANGQGFKVYNYIPSVYDFPYQYLFWWYGTSRYRYQPDTITYLDSVPEYIPGHKQFWRQRRTADQSAPIFLIIEPDENSDRTAASLGNFSRLCVIKEQAFPWKTKVEMREPCKPVTEKN